MVAWLNYPNHTDDATDNLLGLSFSSPLLQEYLNVVGPVTTAWILICLPRLHWLMPPLILEQASSTTAATKTDTNTVESPTPKQASWLDRLPEQLGTDVIAVTSELQYLRVWTSRGCALILGALADVESEAAASGLRVHRSWWVATDHVVSVRRTAAGAICLMSDGRKVPVSRRRRSEVLAHFGDGTFYRSDNASKAVSDTDLN
jgi:DNA-binding LytR/AlgR family response regulator